MSAKVDKATYDRLLYLRSQDLTQEIIGKRLGLSARTVRLYLSYARDGINPFPAEDQDVSSNSL